MLVRSDPVKAPARWVWLFVAMVVVCATPTQAQPPSASKPARQLVNPTGYSTQFNLDSDRAFAYLTWDWIRGGDTKEGILGLTYTPPVEPPPDADGWRRGTAPLKLKYVDPPNVSHQRVPGLPPPIR